MVQHFVSQTFALSLFFAAMPALWLPEPDEIRAFGSISDCALGVAFSADGKHLAACGADHKARVFDVASGKQQLLIGDHPAGEQHHRVRIVLHPLVTAHW